jgi:hypothetical protein
MKRKGFLKAAPAAVGWAASRPLIAEQSPQDVRISSVAYTPADYPIRPQPYADMAHHIDFADAGRQHYDDKDFPRRVRAIRQI